MKNGRLSDEVFDTDIEQKGRRDQGGAEMEKEEQATA
jgi:hypothetical protein